jgi:hypothetical protein
LVWHEQTPDNMHEIEQSVVEDILSSLRSLKTPSDLMYHIVFLSDSLDGESVTVWGEIGDENNFHCQWYKQTDWISITNDKLNFESD